MLDILFSFCLANDYLADNQPFIIFHLVSIFTELLTQIMISQEE